MSGILESWMDYRGYDFEEKTLMVGWQITIRKDDVFVRNSKVSPQRSAVLDDARAYVDGVIALADTATPS
jgi:hypothetical protein